MFSLHVFACWDRRITVMLLDVEVDSVVPDKTHGTWRSVRGYTVDTLDCLKSPVTKYFFSYNLFNSPLK